MASERVKREPTALRRGYEHDVADKMQSLRGQSRKDLQRDDQRGASSPLGHGEVAERERRKRK